MDVIEIDAATNRGIDEIRELREAARYRPARDRYKIYILDEAHQITDAAFNALLKTLEEPPGHVVFMLATTQPEDIPQTIRSRCQNFSFHAVRFEETLGQLRAIAAKEKVEAAEDALALLAEAADGSLRDALSIMDQAVASSSGHLTAETVRQLVGKAPSGTLEEVMQAVAGNASDEVLRLVDKLLSEGQNPAHFARQMVHFLRNATVAKIAGGESSLLQISGDERQRVTRVAELFSEEDLARHLQIMLRTHSELGYRQEQRFHLELGLLKMVHAQRLLPLEQWLSEAAAEAPAPARSPGRPTVVPDNRRSEPAAQSRANNVSPFAADSARKAGSKPQLSVEPSTAPGPRVVAPLPVPVIMGSAAVEPVPEVALGDAETAPGANPAMPPDDMRAAVLNALSGASHNMLVSMLEAGEWQTEGNELVVRVTSSATVIDMSLGADAKRLAIATASGVAGRPMKFKVVPGGTPQPLVARPGSNGNGRGRAEQDPVVRRLKEKFGAEIRTIIDYREKR